MANPNDYSKVRLLHLTCITSPARVPVFNTLQKKTAEFCVLTSGEEDNRIWTLPGKIDFRVKKSRGFTIPYWKKAAGHKKFDRKYLHINPGYLVDLIRFNPDWVLSLEMGFRTLIAWAYCTVARKPLCVQWGGTLHTERNISPLKAFLRKYFFAKIVPKWLSYGTTSTEYLISLGVRKDKIREGQNCVDNKHFSQPAKPLFNSLPRPVLLYVGRFIPLKGLEHLLKACKLLQDKGYSFTLLLIGAGHSETQLRHLQRQLGLKNVIFHPFVDYDTLPSVYQSADIFISPTLDDVWGLVVNEALASGLRVLCSKYAGCAKDLIPDTWQFDPAEIEGSMVPKMEMALKIGREGRKMFLPVEAMQDTSDLAEAILNSFTGDSQ